MYLKKTIKNKVLILLLPLLLNSCATWSTASVTPIDTSKNIIITSGDINNHQYKVLGDIDVSVNKTTVFNHDPTKDDIDSELQKEAAKLGANAVIFTHYGDKGISLMSWGTLRASGRAIVFTDKVN